MTGRDQVRQYRDLASIGGARLAIARGRLAEAEEERGQCDRAATEAEQNTGEAYVAWSRSIGSQMLGPGALDAAAQRLLMAERSLVGARKLLDAATREADEAAREFRAAEARARAEGERAQKLGRRYRTSIEERAQDDVAELMLRRRRSGG